MSKIVSLLRGINVSGHRKLPMKELKALYEELGFKDVQTYIQSGNVVFNPGKVALKSIPAKIEKAILDAYGYDVPVIVCSPEQWEEVMENNPFLKEKGLDVDKLYVSLLDATPAKGLEEKIDTAAYLPDRFIISGTAIYQYFPEGYGRTKLTNTFFENKLKVKATTRNWRTMTVLREMMK